MFIAAKSSLGNELVYVVEGAIQDEFGTLTAGHMGYRPDGCVHTGSSPNRATVIAIITGTTAPATERGDAPGWSIPGNSTCIQQFHEAN